MTPGLTAIVTGASRGIGRAIAQQLAARGVRIVVHYVRQRAAAEATIAALSGTGHLLLAADMARPDEIVQLWERATAKLGSIKIVVNNAGIYEDHPPLSTDAAAWQLAWRRTLAANLEGPAYLTHLAVQAMAASPEPFDVDHGRGRIVN